MLETGDPATSLRELLSWSYRQLSPSAAAMFALLGVHCGPDITVPAAASLAGFPAPTPGWRWPSWLRPAWPPSTGRAGT